MHVLCALHHKEGGTYNVQVGYAVCSAIRRSGVYTAGTVVQGRCVTRDWLIAHIVITDRWRNFFLLCSQVLQVSSPEERRNPGHAERARQMDRCKCCRLFMRIVHVLICYLKK